MASGLGNGNVYLVGDMVYENTPMVRTQTNPPLWEATSGDDMLGLMTTNNVIVATSVESGGYNQNVPEDADSTSFCLLFLLMLEGNLDNHEKSVKLLLEHQNENNGGFVTYNSQKIKNYLENQRPYVKNISFKGWQSPHCCVTPISTRLLLYLNDPNTTNSIEKAYEFIKNKQNKDGFWSSYWWNDIYATYHSLNLMNSFRKNENKDNIDIAIEWLINFFSKNSLSSEISYMKNPFYTALSLKSLLISPRKVPQEIIIGISNWLLYEQLEDGSWPSYPILKIPKPNVEDITINNDYHSCRLHEDKNRIFTTATCLSALSDLFFYFKGE